MNKVSSLMINSISSIQIPMSLQCQLRCKYCYIRDNNYKTIPVDYDSIFKVMQSAVDFFQLTSKETSAIIPWGAEPLCNWKNIEKALRYAFTQYPGFVQTAWSTNGLIAPKEYLDFISEYIDRLIYVQISLDGPEEVQDYSRIHKDGSGSFKQVMKTVETIYNKCPNLGNKLIFKATLSPEQLTLHHFYKSVRFFLTEMKLSLDPTSLVMDTPYSPEAIKALKEDLDRLKEEWGEIKAVNKDATIGLFYKLENHQNPHCSACSTQVEVDLDGNFYPCHAPVTTNSIKEYFCLGNVFTKTINDKAIYRTLYGKYNAQLVRSPLCNSCCINAINPAFCYVCFTDSMISTHNVNFFPLSTCKVKQTIGNSFLEWKNDNIL